MQKSKAIPFDLNTTLGLTHQDRIEICQNFLDAFIWEWTEIRQKIGKHVDSPWLWKIDEKW